MHNVQLPESLLFSEISHWLIQTHVIIRHTCLPIGGYGMCFGGVQVEMNVKMAQSRWQIRQELLFKLVHCRLPFWVH